MVGASFIFDGILNELKSGQSDAIERQMICAAGVGEGQSGSAEVFEWGEPGAEYGSARLIALQVNAANFAGTIVEVEVSSKFGMVRSQFIFSARTLAALQFRFGSGRSCGRLLLRGRSRGAAD